MEQGPGPSARDGLSAAGPLSTRDHGNADATLPSRQVLELLAQGAGVTLDLGRIEAALHVAELEIPPTVARASRQRLTRAAESLGLQVLSKQLSLREAVRLASPEAPLAVFSVTPDGSARWHVLVDHRGGLGRLARILPQDDDRWSSSESLALRLGARDADTVLEWLTAQVALPLHSGADPLDPDFDEHDHDLNGHHSPHGHASPTLRLLRLMKPERRELWAVVLYSIGIGILGLATPIAAAALVNTVAFATLLQPLITLCFVLLVALGLAALIRALQTYVIEFMQQRIFVRVVADVAYRLPRVRMDAFDRQYGPELVNRFFDVLTVQKAAATLLLDGINVVLQSSIGLVVLAMYHESLLAFDLVLIGSLLGIVFVIGRNAIRTSIRESRAKYAVAGWIEELARHPVVFKLSGGADYAMQRADRLARDYLISRRMHFGIVLRQFCAALALQTVAIVTLFAVGGYLVIEGTLTLGQMVAAELIVTLVVSSFTKLGKQLESYYDLLAAVDKLGHLADLPLERSTGVMHAARSKGATVSIHRVSFAYGGATHNAIEEFSLRLEAGERVALRGPNGSGKSTLVDLIFGLREPLDGRIEIDEMDLRDVRLDSWREHVAVVKGIEIFDGTVLENIRMGRQDLSIADVRHALSSVGLLDDILRWPQGLHLKLSPGGMPLSLGQAQRLMLARAIATRPRLLVLDEMLDDMDQELQREVHDAIFRREHPWTVLVVTHSSEVARLCDREVRLERTAVESPALEQA